MPLPEAINSVARNVSRQKLVPVLKQRNRHMFATQNTLTALAAAIALVALTSTASAAEQEVVAYRLAAWKTVHFDDARRAETHAKTVKQLGCEVKSGSHGGHIDVSYRCSKWRKISLNSHDKAHQWENWLKACGFETRHQH